jgi:hypothetical protein
LKKHVAQLKWVYSRPEKDVVEREIDSEGEEQHDGPPLIVSLDRDLDAVKRHSDVGGRKKASEIAFAYKGTRQNAADISRRASGGRE